MRPPLRPKSWNFFTDAIEEGVRFGLSRAIKYEENLVVQGWVDEKREYIVQAFVDEILNAIGERFDWEPSDLPPKG